MKVAIPTEIADNETRVAATPETVKKMAAQGLAVTVQSGAGSRASISDEDYKEAGAHIESDAGTLFGQADIIFKVHRPIQNPGLNRHEADLISSSANLIALLQPLIHHDLVRKLAERKITSFSMDAIPRIARAQKLDALSSQASIAGYKAVLMAADSIGRLMPMMMTAAGTISPAKVLVIGAGVAGLQAIATAKRLGAVVEAFDTRAAVKEQVESLGAKFIEFEAGGDTEDTGGYAKELSKDAHAREMQLISDHAKSSDIVITTAQIPGKPSPVLIEEATVRAMRSGAVIVDLAVEGGGNCTLSEAGRDVVKHGVTIIGRLNVPSLMANQSSQLYARNIMNFLFELYKKGEFKVDLQNEIIKGALVTHQGEIVHEAAKAALNKSEASV